MFAFDFGPSYIKFRPCTRPILSWREELSVAAKQNVAYAGGRPIYIMFSGGMDSEIVCRTFKELDIPFTALTYEYYNGANNDHDTYYAREWCANNGVEHLIRKIDIKEFVLNKIPTYMERGYGMSNIYRYMKLEYIEHCEQELGGYCIQCDGTFTTYKSTLDGEIRAWWRLSDVSGGPRWCKENSKLHNTHFFYTSPETAASYLIHPIVKSQVFETNEHCHRVKKQVYFTEFPDIAERPKYGGYEELNHRITVQFMNLRNNSNYNPKGNQYTLNKMYEDLDIHTWGN